MRLLESHCVEFKKKKNKSSQKLQIWKKKNVQELSCLLLYLCSFFSSPISLLVLSLNFFLF